MKPSIRTKFSLGLVFFFVVILLLSILSAYYLNMLSRKTSAILKENVISVICARDMSDALNKVNQETTNCVLFGKILDSLYINNELKLFDKSLGLEKNNITEIGEDKIANGIDAAFTEYRDSVVKFIKSPKSIARVQALQMKFNNLYTQLGLLSQLNEKAIEIKTDAAKVSAKKASMQMTIVGTVCFLVAFAFTFSFGSYFNERFFQLYNGIKEIASNNYGQRLYFDGKDEFYEISLVFNEMAEKLSGSGTKKTLTFDDIELKEDQYLNDVQELKRILISMKSIEEQALVIISKLENKK